MNADAARDRNGWVHPATVWIAQGPPDPAAAASPHLSAAERELLSGRRRQGDRDRSATARVLLKGLLARDFGIEPASVHLPAGTAPENKPVLRYVRGGRPVEQLRASVSHAQGHVLVAVTDGPAIGVDVEAHASTAFAGFDNIALSAAEREWVARMPAWRRGMARADFWVRKEALLKATGVGLRQDPARLCFASPVAWSASQQPLQRLTVQLVPTGAGHSAAVCVTGVATLLLRGNSGDLRSGQTPRIITS